MEKIKVVLHVAETAIVKLWRFDSSKVADYTRTQVECAMISLFPDIEMKGLRLEMCYYDELAGKITIESDGDMVQALTQT